MNSELKSRYFDIPQNILDKINHTVTCLQGENVRGIQRAKKLLNDKKVKYGQLKTFKIFPNVLVIRCSSVQVGFGTMTGL